MSVKRKRIVRDTPQTIKYLESRVRIVYVLTSIFLSKKLRLKIPTKKFGLKNPTFFSNFFSNKKSQNKTQQYTTQDSSQSTNYSLGVCWLIFGINVQGGNQMKYDSF